MKKIEIIWRELLFSALEKGIRRFEQKELAEKFNFSTSTVFQALKVPRQMGAVRVTGRFFILEDPEKLLYHWASERNPEKEISTSFRAEGSALEIEGMMPPKTVFGAYTAARLILKTPPADYDKVYLYSSDPDKIKERIVIANGPPNLFVLQPDPFLSLYGQKTTLAQTFVDLWNLRDWFARDYSRAVKEKIDGILS